MLTRMILDSYGEKNEHKRIKKQCRYERLLPHASYIIIESAAFLQMPSKSFSSLEYFLCSSG